MAYIGADYLADGYTAAGYVTKSAIATGDGAWLNRDYSYPTYTGQEWFAYDTFVAGNTAVTIGNLLAVPITSFSGAAKQALRVNATNNAVPITQFDTTVNASLSVSQLNLQSLPIASFDTTVNAGTAQIGDITYTISVNSTFGYSHNVSQVAVQTVPLTPVDAIISTTTGDTVVAADRVDVPVTVFQADAAATTKAAAIATVPIPITVFDTEVTVGISVQVTAVLSVPLSVNPVSVVATSNLGTNVTADLSSLFVGVFDAAVVANDVLPPRDVWNVKIRCESQGFAIKSERQKWAA